MQGATTPHDILVPPCLCLHSILIATGRFLSPHCSIVCPEALRSPFASIFTFDSQTAIKSLCDTSTQRMRGSPWQGRAVLTHFPLPTTYYLTNLPKQLPCMAALSCTGGGVTLQHLLQLPNDVEQSLPPAEGPRPHQGEEVGDGGNCLPGCKQVCNTTRWGWMVDKRTLSVATCAHRLGIYEAEPSVSTLYYESAHIL
jgi:hypothetical protein